MPLHLMQTNGGVAPADRARELPIALAASGPAAGVIGGARLAELVGERDVLTFDMGGTTADIGLVIGASPQLRFSGEAAGMPVNLPQIDVLCIGAGGGSIARVDEFGSLSVGPASAGAEPGPAAYGRGGADATVTDAHVVLGTLSAESALAGGVPLDLRGWPSAPCSSRSERRSASAPRQAAAADPAHRQRQHGKRAARDVDRPRPRPAPVRAGRDRRRRARCTPARWQTSSSIPRVVIPRYPGVAAALGPARHRHPPRPAPQLVSAHGRRSRRTQLDAELAQLDAEASELLDRSASVSERFELSYELDMRYRGQAYNLTVPLAARPVTSDTIAAADRRIRGAAPPPLRLHARR